MLLVPVSNLAFSHDRALSFLNAKFASMNTSEESLRATATELLSQNEILQREVQSLIAERREPCLANENKLS